MWDRWAIFAVALLIGGRALHWGWRLRQQKLPAAGAILLGVLAVGVPILLLLAGPETGR